MLVLLVLKLSFLLIPSYGIGTYDDFGCNHYSADEVPGVCYQEEDYDFYGYASEMYVCDNGTLVHNEYSTSDCSGNITDTYTYSSPWWDDDYYCNAESSCNYFIMYKYTNGSNCLDEPIDAFRTGLDGYCENITSTIFGKSRMEVCQDGYYTQTYYTNDNCTGNQTEFGPYDPDFYHWFYDGGDYRLYCSKNDYWSDCNQDTGSSTSDDSSSMGTWSSLGCNHYNGDEVPGVCYVEEDYDFWGYSSQMWICENGTMTEYEYESTDCSGNPSYTNLLTYSWELDDYYCNAESTCNYYIMYKYTNGSNCLGEPIDSFREGLDGYCVNNTYFGTPSSFIEQCYEDGFFTQTYYDTDDCSGSGTEYGPYSPNFYNWLYDDGDFKLYCSKNDYWSECNQNIPTTMEPTELPTIMVTSSGNEDGNVNQTSSTTDDMDVNDDDGGDDDDSVVNSLGQMLSIKFFFNMFLIVIVCLCLTL